MEPDFCCDAREDVAPVLRGGSVTVVCSRVLVGASEGGCRGGSVTVVCSVGPGSSGELGGVYHWASGSSSSSSWTGGGDCSPSRGGDSPCASRLAWPALILSSTCYSESLVGVSLLDYLTGFCAMAWGENLTALSGLVVGAEVFLFKEGTSLPSVRLYSIDRREGYSSLDLLLCGCGLVAWLCGRGGRLVLLCCGRGGGRAGGADWGLGGLLGGGGGRISGLVGCGGLGGNSGGGRAAGGCVLLFPVLEPVIGSGSVVLGVVRAPERPEPMGVGVYP